MSTQIEPAWVLKKRNFEQNEIKKDLDRVSQDLNIVQNLLLSHNTENAPPWGISMTLLKANISCRILEEKLSLIEEKVKLLGPIGGSDSVITTYRKEIGAKSATLDGLQRQCSKLADHKKAVTKEWKQKRKRFRNENHWAQALWEEYSRLLCDPGKNNMQLERVKKAIDELEGRQVAGLPCPTTVEQILRGRGITIYRDV